MGIRESLAPQADVATEPRWARANGTFGEDADIAKRMVEAYVAGIQNGADGLNSGSVVAVVKHWVGYGVAKDGWDGHNYYGRFADFSGHNFPQHLIPFTGAFAAHAGSVMPAVTRTYRKNLKFLEKFWIGTGGFFRLNPVARWSRCSLWCRTVKVHGACQVGQNLANFAQKAFREQCVRRTLRSHASGYVWRRRIHGDHHATPSRIFAVGRIVDRVVQVGVGADARPPSVP